MKYIDWNKFKDEIQAFTTTKAIGNVAYQVGDDPSEVDRARATIINDLDIKPNQLVFVHQSHSDRIEKVDESYFGMGQHDFESGPDCDALYTNKTNIALGIFHADCVPVFIYVPSHHLVGIIHAGFKGTLKEITKKSIATIIRNENIDTKDIYAYIGPSLSSEFYNITPMEKEILIKMGYGEAVYEEGIEIHVNVALLNKIQLLNNGIKDENITRSLYDTGKDEFLFSAYKNHPIGRMASIIMLKK